MCIVFKRGDWVIDMAIGVINKSSGIRGCTIPKFDLWKTRKIRDVLIWDWPIHLAAKPWIDESNVKYLNDTFFEALIIFEELKPNGVPEVSKEITLQFQKEKLTPPTIPDGILDNN